MANRNAMMTNSGEGYVQPDEEKTWNDTGYSSYEEYQQYITNLTTGAVSSNNFGINTQSGSSTQYNSIAESASGIFGMPYQFSNIVDPIINSGASNAKIGRKFNDKVFSIAPVLFLTPGEPVFMQGYGKTEKENIANRILDGEAFDGDSDNGLDFDDGRYYSFASSFPEYKKYANVALRALALFMGIQDITVPVPGSTKNEKLSNIDVGNFMNNNFTKLFGSQSVVPFFLDAANSISESYSNSTTESIVSQTVNGFSSAAREVQFIMGHGDYGNVLSNIGAAVTDVASNLSSALGDVANVVADNSVLSRVTNELTTIVSGGKIVFPEIWSDSEYDRSYSINIKLRSPDPDPVSIFLNIYLPIILLVSMAAPRQIGNKSNSYQSPFLVRATYKSIFSCDLGIIGSLSIDRGGDDKWNVLGQPTSADVTLEIKDLYSTMFVSKRMGLISNTAQLDYLSVLAGIDLNEYEPTRLVKLWAQILGDTPRDWASDFWGGIKSTLNREAAKLLGLFSDTRFLQ